MIKILSQSIKSSPAHVQTAEKGLQKFLQRSDIGFSQLTKRKPLWDSSHELGKTLRKGFSDLVVVGIGGSSLGVRVIAEIFSDPQNSHRLHFCDNVDAAEFQRLMDTLPDLAKTAWLAISKSGTTLETLMAVDLAAQIYQKKGLRFSDHFFAISEPRSNPLHDFAQSIQRPCLEIPLDVGGRFSVLSPVGLVPAAFLGLDTEEIRKGAESAFSKEGTEAITQVMAQTLQSYDRQEWITLFWYYCSWMKNFGGWTQQLWAESLSKKTDRQNKPAKRASAPLMAIGACDQHSILQQVMEGARDRFVIFTRVKSAETSQLKLEESKFAVHQFLRGRGLGDLLAAEAKATEQALTQVGVSNMVLQVEDLSARSVGELFMFWQLVVAGLGECLDINAFDQPGVELGKRLARQILQG
jgi:glucose-6-phosphate isomerase